MGTLLHPWRFVPADEPMEVVRMKGRIRDGMIFFLSICGGTFRESRMIGRC